MSLLGEDDFLPAFAISWRELLAGRPLGACPADWWEEEAKPAFQDFCKRFARQPAHRRQETAFFLQMALQRAQVAENWTSVALLRGRLRVMAAYGFAGRAVRSRQNQGAAAMDTIFQVAEEAAMPRQGPLSITRGGQVLVEEGEVEEEIVSYFEALLQGRHAASVARPEPFDLGQPFQPNFTFFDDFTRGMPTLDCFQTAAMALPITLLEREAAAGKAAAGKAPGLDGLPYKFYRTVLPLVGDCMVEAMNVMLERGELSPSLRRGAVRLLPKVPGGPGGIAAEAHYTHLMRLQTSHQGAGSAPSAHHPINHHLSTALLGAGPLHL